MRDELHHGGMQLVLVALRRRAAFEVADLAASLGDDQRAFELAGVARVDAEVRRQLHRTAHALGDVDERAVGEHRRVQCGIEVVAGRHDAAEIALDQFGVVLHRVREGTEDHTDGGELLAEGGSHRDRVEDRVDGHARQARAFVQRHVELLVGLEQLGVDVGQALRPVLAGTSVPSSSTGPGSRSARCAVGPMPAATSIATARRPTAATCSRNSGSRLRREIARTVTSSRPGGRASVSTSVTKPCR